MSMKHPQVPYGAVYFRKSNPPRKDWERDYAQASRDGMNLFRHWFMWSAIEIAPGRYDWEEYDAQLELAAKYGIRTIIAEMTTFTPEWLNRKYRHLLLQQADGKTAVSRMQVSSAIGGHTGGLCLDHDESKRLTGEFLRELVLRYTDHPGMFGYDVWNECNYGHQVCYCPATQNKFREWLREKYGSLEALGKAWRRYSFAEWEDVQAPVFKEAYPECIDWLEFRKHNFHAQMQWKVELIRSLDSRNSVTAHGIAASLQNMAAGGSDDWLAASKVSSYGLTWVTARKGSEPWKQSQAIDLVRAGSRGKPFWHAEMQGGPLWLQPQVVGREKEDGRVATAADVRLWNMTSLAGGARGIMYLRWRSLLDGPLFGAFGLYDTDGLQNPRSEAASEIAKWANGEAQRDLFLSSPVKGDIGIVVVPETQVFNHLLEQAGEGEFYTKCMWGTYQGFFDNHIQADYVLIDHIDEYCVLYLPYPIKLSAENAGRIAGWVEKGGILISEGCPAYFGDAGRVGVVQPNHGWDRLFGALQHEVEFMPDIAQHISFDLDGAKVPGGLFLQSYAPTTGTVRGTYADGRVAAVQHSFGKGKAMLVGTFPSEGYFRTKDENGMEYFRRVFAWSGGNQSVKVNGPHLRVRLQDGAGGKFAWILNPHRESAEAEIEISPQFAKIASCKVLWGDPNTAVRDNLFSIRVPAKDAIVLQLM
ncbi:beta-galactosidase [Paenibacillus humicola]|uniref:beta-galactosidase n=1 Tax=Paenibacillus humicola TaxID=3110540 RepID=UPI00237AE979|nr:beta-galactosidase [Paenibacillus humicola]